MEEHKNKKTIYPKDDNSKSKKKKTKKINKKLKINKNKNYSKKSKWAEYLKETHENM